MYINLTDDTVKTIIEALASSARMSDYYSRKADEADKKRAELMAEIACRDEVIAGARKSIADLNKDGGFDLREVAP